MKKTLIIFCLTILLTVFAAQVAMACCPYSGDNCSGRQTCTGYHGGTVTCASDGTPTYTDCTATTQICQSDGAIPPVYSVVPISPSAVGHVGTCSSSVGGSPAKTKECCTLKQNIDLGDTTNPLKCDKKTVAAPNPEAAAFCEGSYCSAYANEKNWGIFCMMDSMFNVTNWIFYILTVVAVIMFIWGGFSYVISAGDPEKAGKGKKILTYGIIGLAIALLAKAIPSVVKAIVGM